MESTTTMTRPVPKEHTLVHFEIPASDPAKIAKSMNNSSAGNSKSGKAETWTTGSYNTKTPVRRTTPWAASTNATPHKNSSSTTSSSSPSTTVSTRQPA